MRLLIKNTVLTEEMGHEFKVCCGQYLYHMCRRSHSSAALADGRLGGDHRQHSIKQDNTRLLAELGHTLAILRGGLCLFVPQDNMQTVSRTISLNSTGCG